MNDVQDENKHQNDNLTQMMTVILKKFEIVKYSLSQNHSMGTQTIVAGTSRINGHSNGTDHSGIKSFQKHGR